MLPLGLALLLCLCENKAAGNITVFNPPTSRPVTTTELTTTTKIVPQIISLQPVATPDYPVAEGQSVRLYCGSNQVHEPPFNWSWHHLNISTWQTVAYRRELILTESRQSGAYQCRVVSKFFYGNSKNLTVYIVSMQMTVAEKLGIAAFILSFLTLVIALAFLSWTGWKQLDQKVNASNAAVKSFPGPGMASKGGLPEMDGNRDVYMNYTNSNQNYTDLDPTSNEDNVYSILS